ncbi:metabotropic glutamate receptor 3-like isoform X2 [Mytilus californianus]|uniref:metabotropic glutamate receptor 3-like isoform X1 n=1 Tax=Mytilus californianus TaxID=6549 RepID=UPI00224528CD|nr:metabotropic glutamate receptor 3-like isoform X1 [Mytilus californianus]XP_052073194.1 metabotropic glutamate receptor 3-like isoform X2 [Mytilus californianus]
MALLKGLLILCILNAIFGQEDCPATTTPCFYENIGFYPSGNNQANEHYYIGGLFGVHEMPNDAYSCSRSAIRDRGIINLQAFLWGIQNIGSTISAGGVALDSCSSSDQNIENILSFETCKVTLGETNPVSPRNLLAYVGPDRSTQVPAVSSLLYEMNKTHISHAATSPRLRDGDTDSFFLRTVPTDVKDVLMMKELLGKLNARFVIAIYQDDEYGMGLFEAFNSTMSQAGVCIVYKVKMTSTNMAEIAAQLRTRIATRYVALLMTSNNVKMLFDYLRSTSVPFPIGQFSFIGTSSWGTLTDVTSGGGISGYTVQISAPTSIENEVNQFYSYLESLKPSQNMRNPWYDKWWRSKVDCTTGVLADCEATKSLVGKSYRDVYTPFTLMAIKAIKKGIEAVSQSECVGSAQVLCSNLLNQHNRGQLIRNAIILATDSNGRRYFQDNGELADNLVNFKIYKIDSTGNYNVFANYDGNNFILSSGATPVIDSQCPNSPCLECGEMPSTTQPTTRSPTTTTVTTTTDITEGGKYTQVLMLSTQEFTGVYADQRRDMYELRFELGHKWIIALGVLAGVGLLAVLVFEVYILYKLMGTKTGRQWRTLWLGQLLLFGIFLSYLVLFAYLPIPTDATCGITRFGVGLSYSIMFAVLLVKLMVILTSKSSEQSILADDIASPNYLKGIYQFLMFVFVVGVQVVIDAQWLILVPPRAVKVITNNGDEAWVCNHFTWEAKTGWRDMKNFVRTGFENHLISLVYIMFLILMNTVVAMRAHGIITNHRESIFIGIASGFCIPIWIAWGLVAGLNREHDVSHEFTDACMAFGLFITATLVLFSMFLPKVRQLVNMGVEGIYLEDDRESYYAQSVIMAPPSYKSRPNSVIYVNHTDPVVLSNGDPNHLKHPGSMYSGHSAPVYTKRPEAMYATASKSLKLTNDLSGKHPQQQERRRPQSEAGYLYRKSRSESGGTVRSLRKSRSQTDLGAL